MGKYKCWAPQLETENEARTYNTSTRREAAEAFAKWSYREEEFNDLIVHVRSDDGAVFSFDVEAEMVLELDVGAGIRVADDAITEAP